MSPDLAVFISLRRRDKMAAAQSSASAQIDRLAARLVLLPVVYLCGVRRDSAGARAHHDQVAPIAVNRVIGMAGGTTSPIVSIVAGTLFTLTGCADVVLFSLSASSQADATLTPQPERRCTSVDPRWRRCASSRAARSVGEAGGRRRAQRFESRLAHAMPCTAANRITRSRSSSPRPRLRPSTLRASPRRPGQPRFAALCVH